MNRRDFCRASIGVACLGSGLWRPGSTFGAQAGPSLGKIRRVLPSDGAAILELMRSCVNSSDSFHGLCNAVEWTTSWAQELVNNRSRSIVVESAEATLVAFMDLPSKKVERTGNEAIDHHRRAFWCGAAGVRVDLLGRDRASEVFLGVLQNAFQDMMELGYEFARAAAPWAQHPYLPKRFEAYAGVKVEPFLDDKGNTKYLIEWRLQDAVAALVEDPLAQAAGLRWSAGAKPVPGDG